jgi:RHS repeat-associated protein
LAPSFLGASDSPSSSLPEAHWSEYLYLREAEIAPTRQSRTQVDIPVAVVDAVNTASPQLYMVHADHLGRPVRMTNSTKAAVWSAEYTPWGAPHSLTGAAALNARFPGQWFQLEAGLHYNWHRHYDPSLGRYTQPDPLGFVDGPSVYAYAGNSPQVYVDPDGRFAQVILGYCRLYPGACAAAAAATAETIKNICLMAAEHTKGKRPSTTGKHQSGEARKGKDQGGEKADDRRYDMKAGESKNQSGPPSSPPKDSPQYLRPGPKPKD